MIRDNLQKQINEALKAHDELATMTLRMLSAALTNAEIENKRVKLTEEQELQVVKREVKKRKDAIEIYEKAGAQDRVDKEKKELEILQKFLPAEMSDEDLSKIIDEVVKEAGQDFGKVMGAMMARVKGQADGSRVSALVRERLQG